MGWVGLGCPISISRWRMAEQGLLEFPHSGLKSVSQVTALTGNGLNLLALEAYFTTLRKHVAAYLQAARLTSERAEQDLHF